MFRPVPAEEGLGCIKRTLYEMSRILIGMILLTSTLADIGEGSVAENFQGLYRKTRVYARQE